MYKNDYYELHDCNTMVAFMEKIVNSISAMNSRNSETALCSDINCQIQEIDCRLNKLNYNNSRFSVN